MMWALLDSFVLIVREVIDDRIDRNRLPEDENKMSGPAEI